MRGRPVRGMAAAFTFGLADNALDGPVYPPDGNGRRDYGMTDTDTLAEAKAWGQVGADQKQTRR